jgi:hypothetical protein
VSASSWSQTPRGRRELLAAGLFCLANVLVPLFITDLYPFSRAPMFADSPSRYCDYSLTGPDGTALAPADFGLQRNYWGNPLGVGVGYWPPESVDRFGEVADRAEVSAFLERRLARFPELPYVVVTQEVVGPLPGGRTVGPLERRTWRVDNPHARGGR